MRAIRFIITAVALPKGRFPRQAMARAGKGERYDQILAFAYPDNSLSRWGAPRTTCQLLPKAKARVGEKCRSGGVYYKARRGTTNQTCLRSVV